MVTGAGCVPAKIPVPHLFLSSATVAPSKRLIGASALENCRPRVTCRPFFVSIQFAHAW